MAVNALVSTAWALPEPAIDTFLYRVEKVFTNLAVQGTHHVIFNQSQSSTWSCDQPGHVTHAGTKLLSFPCGQ